MESLRESKFVVALEQAVLALAAGIRDGRWWGMVVASVVKIRRSMLRREYLVGWHVSGWDEHVWTLEFRTILGSGEEEFSGRVQQNFAPGLDQSALLLPVADEAAGGEVSDVGGFR